MQEKWDWVPGFAGMYLGSSEGRAYSVRRKTTDKNGKSMSINGRILKPKVHNTGKAVYYQYSFYKNGVSQDWYIHRMVAEMFVKNNNKDAFTQVHHRDEDTSNNKISNLMWCTPEMNNNFGNHNKRMSKSKVNGKGSKQVAQIFNEKIISIWPSTKEAERVTGIDSHRISGVARGVRGYKSAGGFKWKYVES